MSCTWPVANSCLPEVTTEEDTAKLQSAVDTAVHILWSFTGRRYGCCPRLARPCARDCDAPLYWLPGVQWFPELDAGVWRNVSCSCGPTCTVGGPGVVHLPGPVCSVTAVTVDGAVIDPSLYVLEGDRLYHSGGRWPDQDLTRAAGSPGTWTVEYLQGVAPPVGADQMVAMLALEFWKLCQGDKTCRLPKGVESISRQGVSMRMVDPTALFGAMRTGIPEVDLWVAAVNPTRQVSPSAVSSPDYSGSGY